MKDNEYLNVTRAFSDASEESSKDLKTFVASPKFKEIIGVVESELGTGSGPAFYNINFGVDDIRGLYCHRLLAPHVLSVAAPSFAVKVSKILNMYHDQKAEMKYEECVLQAMVRSFISYEVAIPLGSVSCT